jgi:hypothetical protein
MSSEAKTSADSKAKHQGNLVDGSGNYIAPALGWDESVYTDECVCAASNDQALKDCCNQFHGVLKQYNFNNMCKSSKGLGDFEKCVKEKAKGDKQKVQCIRGEVKRDTSPSSTSSSQSLSSTSVTSTSISASSSSLSTTAKTTTNSTSTRNLSPTGQSANSEIPNNNAGAARFRGVSFALMATLAGAIVSTF